MRIGKKPLNPFQYLKDHYQEDPITGCHNWTGAINRVTGFGIFKCVSVSKSTMNAQRASWFLHKGPVESRQVFVLQKCKNQLCVNPEHLFLGTVKESMEIANNRNC